MFGPPDESDLLVWLPDILVLGEDGNHDLLVAESRFVLITAPHRFGTSGPLRSIVDLVKGTMVKGSTAKATLSIPYEDVTQVRIDLKRGKLEVDYSSPQKAAETFACRITGQDIENLDEVFPTIPDLKGKVAYSLGD